MVLFCLFTSAANKANTQRTRPCCSQTHDFCIMHNSNRPEETLMAAHMEVLAVTGEKMRRRIHEGRATLSGSKCHERCLLSKNEGFSFSSLGCMLEVGL